MLLIHVCKYLILKCNVFKFSTKVNLNYHINNSKINYVNRSIYHNNHKNV